jgi:hypothetical protein
MCWVCVWLILKVSSTVCPFLPCRLCQTSTATPTPHTCSSVCVLPAAACPHPAPPPHTCLPCWQLARKAGSGVSVALQVFIAPSREADSCRKPARGMWDFMLQNCNNGIAPGVCVCVTHTLGAECDLVGGWFVTADACSGRSPVACAAQRTS